MHGPTIANQAMNNIEYSAEFIPFSLSRSKNNEYKSLNWIVTLKKGGVKLITDYMQGQAHVLNYDVECISPRYKTTLQQQIADKTCESGKVFKYFKLHDAIFMVDKKGTKKSLGPNSTMCQPVPVLKDVIYALLIDSDVLEHVSFKEWAYHTGYDTDSIAANNIYQDCIKIGLNFKPLFTPEEYRQLYISFEDY